ncbi:TPA: amino acid ABC transporter ATP-binding protein [Legionella pneumophila]|nr:amino acid ABC transporter ATP-binding protein [Legionella pneumophila]
MLQVINASKKIGDVQVLNEINLSIQANSIVGLVGPSGSGKTTLLRCIQQLESIDSGSIQCEGKSGFMFQDFQLFPHMTVLNNLIYAPSLHDKTADHIANAWALLAMLGLSDKAHSYPQGLSGGQKQRVALARSLMMKPDLLLCDEPTSGLDMATTNDVIALLNTVKTLKITMLIASHDLFFLSNIAERLLVVRQGQLIADFRTQEVSDPILYLQQFYQGEIL